MNCVLKIEGNADGFPCSFVGEYIADFDAHFGGTTDRGRGKLTTTKHLDEAKQFPDLVAALDYWKQVSPTVPIRSLDGAPNRPLTAFHVSVETFEDLHPTGNHREEEVRIEV